MDEIEGMNGEETVESVYEELAQEEAERVVDDVGMPQHKTLEEQEISGQHLSDLQAVIKMRFPDYGNVIDNGLMMARISPDIFKALLRLKINAEVRKCDPYKPVDVTGISMKTYTQMTIGLDGKGGVDLIELAGVANDKEIANLSKSLGLTP